ncbi:MAG: C25 family cysteine peptidase, partial [Candidatus Aureabacteria bacterium]|nr:C25 family cysteine peptidase [Candidatus Auribacterota bacterium]
EEVAAALEDGILDDPVRRAALSSEERELLEIKKSLRSLPEASRDDAPDRRSGLQTPGRGPGLQPGLFPADAVEVGAPYWQRDRQYVNLLVNPVRYLGSRRTIVYHPRIVVRLNYGPPVSPNNQDPFARYKKQFELARAGCFKAMVTEESIQEISYQDLLDAGFPLGTDPRNLKIFHLGEEIPIFVDGEEDGIWHPGDYLHFYGRANADFFSQTNVYWLFPDTGRGQRMAEVDFSLTSHTQRQTSFSSPRHLEENHLYFADMPNGEGQDHWFWNFAGVGYALQTGFSLQGVSPDAALVAFTGRFFGLTSLESYDPDHHTRVTLNGTVVGDFRWDGQVEFVLQTNLPQALFLEGANILRVEEIGDTGAPYDFIYVNNFDFAYAHNFSAASPALRFLTRDKTDYHIGGFTAGGLVMYDITKPKAPKRILGFSESGAPPVTLSFGRRDLGVREYLASAASALPHPALEQDQPSSLDDRSHRIDYIAITHPLFAAAVQPLIDFRAARGLAVEPFLIQDVYDTFSFGNLDPAAIRRFLKYAYNRWRPPAPYYALLVGTGHYDYLNYLNTGRPNYLPPHLFSSSFMETASDNWFACVAGDDIVPDYAIGRLCVRSAAETSAFVQKIIDYENGTSGLPWQGQIQMVADNPDSGGDFPYDSDVLIASSIPDPYAADKAYLPILGLAAT